MFVLFAAATVLGIYVITKYATKDGSSSGPALSPADLAALNALPWIPIATDATPKNPDGSGVTAHWTLPVGAEVHFFAQHGVRADAADLSHVAEVIGIVNAEHKPGNDPYEVFVTAIQGTKLTSEGEKLPQVGDALFPTPGKIISYKLPGGTKI